MLGTHGSPQASADTEISGAVSLRRLTSGPHVVVEKIVGHLRAAYLARIDVESVVNATPDAVATASPEVPCSALLAVQATRLGHR
jgi:hypothetical protein